MSYQVLARKWRPNQFSDVLGQEHVLMALSNALSQQRLHHAYLLSGTRGVGKTTIARIFAKGLNCEQGIVATPCGTCATCQEIARGSFVDLLEIDAASRTKVEDTRELLDNVQYKPARGRFKVYLIDEVHMLSRHSFNALLKTLEEPPEHVKFILATTDPQKLPVTVLSRCLQLHLKHLDVPQIENKLTHILTQEALPFDARALKLLAKAANGSMRDALSLTDQAIAQGAGSVHESGVASMLGILNSDFVLRLLEALAADSAPQLMQAVQELACSGVEWDRLLSDMAAQLHQLAVAQLLGPTYAADPSAPKIAHLSGQFSAQEVQLFYQIVLQGRQDLPFAPDGRSGVEMTLLRMLAFRPEEITPVSLAPLAHDHAIAGNNSVLCGAQAAPVVASTHASAAKNLTALKAQLQQKEPLKPVASVTPPVPEVKQEVPLLLSAQSASAPQKKAERDDSTLLAPSSEPIQAPELVPQETEAAWQNFPETKAPAVSTPVTQQESTQLLSQPQQAAVEEMPAPESQPLVQSEQTATSAIPKQERTGGRTEVEQQMLTDDAIEGLLSARKKLQQLRALMQQRVEQLESLPKPTKAPAEAKATSQNIALNQEKPSIAYSAPLSPAPQQPALLSAIDPAALQAYADYDSADNELEHDDYYLEQEPLKQSEDAQDNVSRHVQSSAAITATQEPACEALDEQDEQDELENQRDAESTFYDHDYRWQASSAPEKTECALSPAEIKSTLQNERTPEMQSQLELEASGQDSWSCSVAQLAIPKLLKQLALNAAMEREGETVRLYLRTTQAHLKTPSNIKTLTQALSEHLAASVVLHIEINDTHGVTPLEWRDKIYADKLAQAKQSLHTDPFVILAQQRFGATIDEASIRPL